VHVMQFSIAEANKLWDDLKKRIRDDPSFVKKSDGDKVNVYQKSEFSEFYTNFPIVCRYMICMGQFSNKAFKRYLVKCKAMQSQKTKPGANSEDLWVRRQADYVRYLWESYQRQHFSSSDAQNIWQHAYYTLTTEFKDFKDMHKDVEEKLKVDKKTNKTEMIKELINRIATNEQTLDGVSTKNLIKKLEDDVIQQRMKTLVNQISTDVETIPSTTTCRGARK
jgi:predicted YcjX-like family ATPase